MSGTRPGLLQPLQNGAVEHFAAHRLGNTIVHAGANALIALITKGIRGKGNNRLVLVLLAFTDRERRLDAVDDLAE